MVLKTLAMDVWLMEQLKNAPPYGLTLEELQTRWKSNPKHDGVLGRTTMTRHRKTIQEFFGVIIQSKDKKHYTIANPEVMTFDSLANDLLASVQEYLFLEEYGDLGDAIQPQQILVGREYLSTVGDAIRYRKKLKVRYQKFSDEEPYTAILHPYCMKACQNRWYILAVKEGSEHHVQTFALDRMQSLHILDDHYEIDISIDAGSYFKDSFGIWVDFERYPVQDIRVQVSRSVAKYWLTLPLHHSQRKTDCDGDNVTFTFHISPSPDFVGELKRWGVEYESNNII